jgi:hypothetical protein
MDSFVRGAATVAYCVGWVKLVECTPPYHFQVELTSVETSCASINPEGNGCDTAARNFGEPRTADQATKPMRVIVYGWTFSDTSLFPNRIDFVT